MRAAFGRKTYKAGPEISAASFQQQLTMGHLLIFDMAYAENANTADIASWYAIVLSKRLRMVTSDCVFASKRRLRISAALK